MYVSNFVVLKNKGNLIFWLNKKGGGVWYSFCGCTNWYWIFQVLGSGCNGSMCIRRGTEEGPPHLTDTSVWGRRKEG